MSFDSKSFLGSFSATLFETKKWPKIRTTLVIKEMHIKVKHIFESEKITLFFRSFENDVFLIYI